MPLFLVIFLGNGCLDYVALENVHEQNYDASPPMIDAKYLSPHPSSLLNAISVGKNCKGQIFRVPPIKDKNPNDELYGLWFLDNRLAIPEVIIKPEFRDGAIITLTINEQFLLSHFETKIPRDFFGRPHTIEFYISDIAYTIPESRYIDEGKEHGDYAYWIVYFSNDPC